MTNILPAEHKKRMVRAVRMRFVLAGAVIIAIAGFVSALALVPAFLFAYLPGHAQSESRATAPVEEANLNEERAIIARTRALITQLLPLVASEKESLADVIEVVMVSRGTGVTIGSMSYVGGGSGVLTVGGTAQNRDQVSTYREALSGSGKFENVAVPVAALVGALSGSFTVTLTGSF